MKQITMQEAMRAVADGKKVYYKNPYESNGIIEAGAKYINFSIESEYFLRETVKVALFEPKLPEYNNRRFAVTSRVFLLDGRLIIIS